jgi:hypothetical protein
MVINKEYDFNRQEEINILYSDYMRAVHGLNGEFIDLAR